MASLSDLTVEELAAALKEAGHNPVNAFRILRDYWAGDGSLDIAALDISKLARAFLESNYTQRISRIIRSHESVDGTLKLLIGSEQGGAVECVLMPSHRDDRVAVCLSSQIGCAMGCDFCASTKNGLLRNLGIGEIVEQFMYLRVAARERGRRIASLVFMGMGEPLHNLANVIPAIRLLAAPGLGAMGNRAITVSTVGVVPGVDELADAGLGVQLALSLHAPDDATRARLVPMNRKWAVCDVLAAARRYQNRVGRPVNIEYCLLAGVNDSDAQADLLAALLADFRAHVNLIPYNAIGPGVSGTVYRRPTDERIARFAARLTERGVVAHIRRARGDDVAAACGQLAHTSGNVA